MKQKGLLHSGRSPETVQISAARQDGRQHQTAAPHGYALSRAARAGGRAHRARRLVRTYPPGGEAGQGYGVRRRHEERQQRP